MAFKILTIGFQSAVSYLGELQRVMSSLNKQDITQMRKIGEDDIIQHFKDQKFRPLSRATILRRQQNARAKKRNKKVGLPSDKILIVSKKLMLGTRSFATAKGFLMENRQPHFGPHNFGFGYIPQREFMYLSEKAVNLMVAIPYNRLNKVASKSANLKRLK